MLGLKKFYSVRKIKILQNKFHWKKFSTEVKNELEDSEIISSLLKKISYNFLIPSLGQGKLNKINEITGLSTRMNHLSWAKLSVPTSKIVEWNCQSKPEDFRNLDEASLLKLAYKLRQTIPISDLYVMEKIGSREGSKNLNDVRLSSMLMVLLNYSTNSAQEDEKVVFQKENIMNILYNLIIGSERISARQVFEAFLYEANECEKTNVLKGNCAILDSLTKINLENLKFYDKSSLVQQESLSFVLLLTLSFIDVFIYQNVESLRKFQMITKFKKIQK